VSAERAGGPSWWDDLIAWVCALIVVGVLTGFAGLLVTGEYINDGEVVLRVTQRHGLHLGDLFVGAGWALAVLAVLVLTVRRGRRQS
jgi:hypothetical protein